MNEVLPSLTVTGLIATVVSVLFGVAALYVSHRRRTQPGGNTLLTAQTASTISPAESLKDEHRARIPMAADIQEPAKPAPKPAAPALVVANAAMTGSAPLFNRLSTRGVESPAAATPEPDNNYVWE